MFLLFLFFRHLKSKQCPEHDVMVELQMRHFHKSSEQYRTFYRCSEGKENKKNWCGYWILESDAAVSDNISRTVVERSILLQRHDLQQNSSHSLRLSPAQSSFTVQNCGLKHHSFILSNCHSFICISIMPISAV